MFPGFQLKKRASRAVRLGLLGGALGAALVASGCVRHDAEFSHRKEYGELIPEAQEFVHEALEQHFGEPTRIVAWEKLPLKMHGAAGTVGEGATKTSIPVVFAQRNLTLEPVSKSPGCPGSWSRSPAMRPICSRPSARVTR